MQKDLLLNAFDCSELQKMQDYFKELNMHMDSLTVPLQAFQVEPDDLSGCGSLFAKVKDSFQVRFCHLHYFSGGLASKLSLFLSELLSLSLAFKFCNVGAKPLPQWSFRSQSWGHRAMQTTFLYTLFRPLYAIVHWLLCPHIDLTMKMSVPKF